MASRNSKPEQETPESLTEERLGGLYETLAAPMPEEAIQSTSGKATGKGYNTTGYGYQFVVDRLNEVLGPAHWRTIDEMWVEPGPSTSSGKPTYEAVCRMTIEIGSPTAGGWEVLASRTCYGGHLSVSRADAQKGAFTNAFKKTAALFGVGRQAYEGLLDDDSISPEGEARAERTSAPVDRTAPGRGDQTAAARHRLFAIFERVGLSTDAGRALVQKVTGKTSTKELSRDEYRTLFSVLDRIQRGDGLEEAIAAAKRTTAA